MISILALEVVGASNIQEDDIPELMNNEDISFDIFLTQMWVICFNLAFLINTVTVGTIFLQLRGVSKQSLQLKNIPLTNECRSLRRSIHIKGLYMLLLHNDPWEIAFEFRNSCKKWEFLKSFLDWPHFINLVASW